MTKVNEIFEIPERVHQGDFVLKLSEGVTRADETLRSYVVTPQLERAFDSASTTAGRRAATSWWCRTT